MVDEGRGRRGGRGERLEQRLNVAEARLDLVYLALTAGGVSMSECLAKGASCVVGQDAGGGGMGRKRTNGQGMGMCFGRELEWARRATLV